MRSLFDIRRTTRIAIAGLLIVAVLIPSANAMERRPELAPAQPGKQGPEPSGIYDIRDAEVQAGAPALNGIGSIQSGGGGSGGLGTNITECPQAGLKGQP